MVRRVLVAGTFDLLHPGHLYYMEQARSHGDELWAVIARSANVSHKDSPILSATQRCEMVESLDIVDHAVIGSEQSMLEPVFDINPDIIALGYDQHHDPEVLRGQLSDCDIDCTVIRIDQKPEDDEGLYTSSDIVDRILDRHRRPNPTSGDMFSVNPHPSPFGLDIPSPGVGTR